MKTPVITCLVIALVQMSCVLPIPHRRVHVHGVEGEVINSRTARPIQNATVVSSITGNELATTDLAGKFRVKSIYGWHGAYLIGPISYSIFPYFDMETPPPPIRISAKGYRPKEFSRNDLRCRMSGSGKFPLDPQ